MRVIILYVIILAPIHCWSQTTQSDSLKNKEVPQAVKNLLNQYKEQTEKAKKERLPPVRMEIDGIIMDETMSKAGRDFYEIFFSQWVRPKGFYNYYIKIKERPFRFNNTMIEVYLNETLLYQSMLQRRYDDIEQMAKESNRRTLNFINQEKNNQRALNTPYSY